MAPSIVIVYTARIHLLSGQERRAKESCESGSYQTTPLASPCSVCCFGVYSSLTNKTPLRVSVRTTQWRVLYDTVHVMCIHRYMYGIFIQACEVHVQCQLLVNCIIHAYTMILSIEYRTGHQSLRFVNCFKIAISSLLQQLQSLADVKTWYQMER